jgi:hypothetical protein
MLECKSRASTISSDAWASRRASRKQWRKPSGWCAGAAPWHRHSLTLAMVHLGSWNHPAPFGGRPARKGTASVQSMNVAGAPKAPLRLYGIRLAESELAIAALRLAPADHPAAERRPLCSPMCMRWTIARRCGSLCTGSRCPGSRLSILASRTCRQGDNSHFGNFSEYTGMVQFPLGTPATLRSEAIHRRSPCDSSTA